MKMPGEKPPIPPPPTEKRKEAPVILRPENPVELKIWTEPLGAVWVKVSGWRGSETQDAAYEEAVKGILMVHGLKEEIDFRAGAKSYMPEPYLFRVMVGRQLTEPERDRYKRTGAVPPPKFTEREIRGWLNQAVIADDAERIMKRELVEGNGHVDERMLMEEAYEQEKKRLLYHLYRFGKFKDREMPPKGDVAFLMHPAQVSQIKVAFFGRSGEPFTQAVVEAIKSFAEKQGLKLQGVPDEALFYQESLIKPFEVTLSDRKRTPLGDRFTGMINALEAEVVAKLSERYLKSNASKNELRLELRKLGFDL